MRASLTILTAILIASVVAGKNARATDHPSAEICLGMSTALSGPAADLGNQMKQGVLAGLESTNRAGGIKGKKLHLFALDDGYEPARTAPNMRQLLQNDGVLAIIGNVGTPTAIAAVPICDEQHALFFAGFTGGGVLRREPPDRYVINYRASYSEETGAIIDALLDRTGLQPQDIAFFTQRDGYGDAGFGGCVAALKRHGLTDENRILHVSYERNTLAVENALATLLYAEHEPRAVVMVGAYAPCAKFIKLAHEANVRWVFLNVSFVGSESLAAELVGVPGDVIVTQVVPSPLATELPIVRDYQTDLLAQDPTAKPRFAGLEGYIASRILVRALGKIQGDPSRDSIIDAMEQLGDFDLGLGANLRLAPNEHQACHHIWPTILHDGQFVPFDWKDLGKLVRKDAE